MASRAYISRYFFKKTTAPTRVQFDLSSHPNNMFDVSLVAGASCCIR